MNYPREPFPSTRAHYKQCAILFAVLIGALLLKILLA